MVRAKICGITREADLRAAVSAGAHAIGLVVDVEVETPREIPAARAADLAAATPPFVATTLVTMPDSVQAAAALLDRVGTDAVQVHGLPAPAVAGLRARTDRAVVAAVDHESAPAYADAADALLVDSLDEQGGGGTGETHDWARTREAVDALDVPVVLAGGLTPANVAEAVRTVRPYAVDVASGVEATGGVKDHDAVRAFVTRAVEADHEEVAA